MGIAPLLLQLPLELEVRAEDLDLAPPGDTHRELLRSHPLLEGRGGLLHQAAPPHLHVRVLAAHRACVRSAPFRGRLLHEGGAEARVQLPTEPGGHPGVEVKLPQLAELPKCAPGLGLVLEVASVESPNVVRFHSPHRDAFERVQVLHCRREDLLVELHDLPRWPRRESGLIRTAGDELLPHLAEDILVAGVGLAEALDAFVL